MLTNIFREAIRAEQSRAREWRTSLENPQTPLSYPAEWLLDIFNGGRTDSGLRVSELTALQVADVFAAVDIISSAIASQPLNIFERVTAGEHNRQAKRLATEHPLFDLLRYKPNDEMTRFVLMKTMQTHALLWGNAYGEIERDRGGQVRAIWPRNPAQTRPRRIIKTRELIYETSDGQAAITNPDYNEGSDYAATRQIRREDMIFIPGLSLDGRIGQDVIYLARQAVGLALAAEKYAAKFFGNGAVPGGILEIPGKMTPEKLNILRRSWAEAQGGENMHRIAVLESGMKYTKLSSTPSEAQMIEARKQQRAEIAAIFHVPITMLGEMGASRANAEQLGLEFVNYTLSPWITAWEEELKCKLLESPRFGRNAGRTFVAVINTRALTLPDATAKKNYYSAGRQWGFLTPNDILEMENLNPVEGDFGESRLVPVNTIPVDANGEPISVWPTTESVKEASGLPQTKPAAEGEDKAKKEQQVKDRAYKIFWKPWRDAFGRLCARKEHDTRTVERIFGPTLDALGAFLGDKPGMGDSVQATIAARCAILSPETIETIARETFIERIERRHAAPFVLFIARHGESEDDISDKTSGPNDTPLTRTGELQSQFLAAKVALQLPQLAAIYVPNVRRHMQTAEYITKATGVQFQTDDELDPWRIGDLEGSPRDELKPYKKDPEMVPPGGESKNTAIKRSNEAINGYLEKAEKNGPVLLVMSHKNIRWYCESVLESDVAYTLKTGGLIGTDGDEAKEII